MVKKTPEKSHGAMAAWTPSSELSENQPRQNFRLGDITWVKHGASSWWPAQVIDEASVSSKPKKKTSHDALVRLYGTCEYLYVDPWKSNMEFKMILKEKNKTAMEAFHNVLQKKLTRLKSPSDHDEEPVSTKDKTSVRKVRKQEGRKKAPSVTPVVKKEGAGRSGRATAKEYPDASDDSTSQLHDTSASEDLTEVGDRTPVSRRQRKNSSVADGSHGEIKAMVRDILLGDVVARQQAADADEVIFGICDGTKKRSGSGLDADSKRRRKGNTKHDSNSSPSREVAMEGCEQHSARQIKIMQKLGLVAPPGSPFKGLVAAAHL